MESNWRTASRLGAGWRVSSAGFLLLLHLNPVVLLRIIGSQPWRPGVIVREENGMTLKDLDGDGIEETGWDIMYMHIGDNDHVALGTRVNTNE